MSQNFKLISTFEKEEIFEAEKMLEEIKVQDRVVSTLNSSNRFGI